MNNTESNNTITKYNWFGDFKKKNGTLLLPVGGKAIQYIVACVTVVYLFFLFYVISNDSDALDKNYLVYMFALIVPLAFMFLVIMSNAKSSNVIMMSAACTLILILFFAYTYIPSFSGVVHEIYRSWFDFERIPGFSDEASFIASLLIKILMIGIVVVGLSLFYNLFLNQAYRQEGALGFIIYFIFFIPCLFSDFIKYIFNEFKTTPNIVLVLFVLEIIFLILYFFLPGNILKNSLKNGKSIVKEPLFLGSETILAGSEILKKEDSELNDLMNTRVVKSVENANKIIYNRNYAISLWLSYNAINMHKDAAVPMSVFKYGITNEDDNVDINEIVGVPMIAYLHNDEFGFVFTNRFPEPKQTLDSSNMFSVIKDALYEFDEKYTLVVRIPPQKWNNIVFNYHNSHVDLFINGSLERTIELAGAIPEYDACMSFIAGSPNNKLHGALCNVNYFSEPLTKSQITQAYNLLKLQNPPVNNLL